MTRGDNRLALGRLKLNFDVITLSTFQVKKSGKVERSLSMQPADARWRRIHRSRGAISSGRRWEMLTFESRWGYDEDASWHEAFYNSIPMLISHRHHIAFSHNWSQPKRRRSWEETAPSHRGICQEEGIHVGLSVLVLRKQEIILQEMWFLWDKPGATMLVKCTSKQVWNGGSHNSGFGTWQFCL